MAEHTVITRKIEVHLHCSGDSEEAKELLREKYHMWDTINDNLYKAANRIVSHNFFNDEYLERLRIQSPRYTAIKKALRNAKRNKLGESEIKELKSEREQLEKEFKKQRLTFLRGGIPDGKGSIEKSTYDVVRNEFSDVIPSTVVSCLNNNIHKTYDNYRK